MNQVKGNQPGKLEPYANDYEYCCDYELTKDEKRQLAMKRTIRRCDKAEADKGCRLTASEILDIRNEELHRVNDHQPTDDGITRVLIACGWAEPQTVDEIVFMTGLTRSIVERCLAKAVLNGRIERDGEHYREAR